MAGVRTQEALTPEAETLIHSCWKGKGFLHAERNWEHMR